MPVGTHATLDPIKSIHTRGWAYRKAISGRPSRMVLLGMWLLFGPAAAWSLVGLHGVFFSGGCHESDIGTIIGLAVGAFVLSLFAAILYLVTRNYLRKKPMKPGCCEECGYDLTGLPTHRCPECGTRFYPEDWEGEPRAAFAETHGEDPHDEP